MGFGHNTLLRYEKRFRDDGRFFIGTEDPPDTVQGQKLLLPEFCVAANLTCEDQFIRTRTVAQWKASPVTIGKRPCVFVMLSEHLSC